MEALGNDVFGGEFRVTRLGRHLYTVHAWLDRFGSWRRDLEKRIDAGQDVTVDLEIGARLVEGRRGPRRRRGSRGARGRARAARRSGRRRRSRARTVARGADAPGRRARLRGRAARAARGQGRPRARALLAWYELFPRSASDSLARHGTFADVEERLPYVAAMGFDVLYLPPIHPIGRTHRKGPNNAAEASDGRRSAARGRSARPRAATRRSIPQLGTLRRLRPPRRGGARPHGIEIALDIAFQCSPDHP